MSLPYMKVPGWRWPAGWLAWELARLPGLVWSWQADLDVGPDLKLDVEAGGSDME